MNAQDQMVHVVRFAADEDGSFEELDTFVAVEATEDLVDVHLSPRTDETVTFSLTVEGAWRLVRELATAAAGAEAFGNE